MSLDQLSGVLLAGAAIVLVAVIAVRFAARLGIPGLLLYLGLGLVLGSTLQPFDFENPRLATLLGYCALLVILAEGGLTTKVSSLRSVLWPSLVLASVGVAVSIAAVALPLVWLLGLDVRTAVLLGAVLSATDAAAVFSVLRHLRLAPRLSAVLEAEAGFNDAPVVVLVALLSASSFEDTPLWLVPILVLAELVGGAAVGVLLGLASRWLLPRLALPAIGLYPIAVLALLVVAYAAADLAHASGFMAVYVAGVLIGSAPSLPHRRAVLGFADALAWTAQMGLFVMLGMLAEAWRLPESAAVALVAGVALVVLGRPLSALVSLPPFRFPRRMTAFVALAGVRGAVPIVFAAIPLGAGVAGANVVFDATLLVVLVLTVLQTPALPWLARRLRVAEPAEAAELNVDLSPLDGLGTSVLTIDVPSGSRLVGVFADHVGLPPDCVVSLVVRGGHPIVPDRQTRLRAGDRVVIVTPDRVRDGVEQRLRAVSRRGQLAGWLGETGKPD